MQVGNVYIERNVPHHYWTIVERINDKQFRVKSKDQLIPVTFEVFSVQHWVNSGQWLLASSLMRRLLCH